MPKSHVMFFNIDRSIEVSVDFQPLSFVDSFKYLGVYSAVG